MITGLQLIAILFALALIYFALLNFRRGEIDRVEFISWTLIWLAVTLIVIFPALLRPYAEKILITRLFDLMVVGGFILVIVMVSRIYIRTKKIEKKLEKLIRDDAIKDAKKKKQ